MELTKAYAVFANGGMLIKPIYVKRVLDRNGQVIEENQPETVQAISKETAFLMTDLLRAVITEGTGWRIRAMKRPAAGKTGTTNDLKDAWFMGYTPGLVTGVWVGYDDAKDMGKGETGSRAASPIWLGFMSETVKGKPVKDFKVPEGIVFAKIDAKTGLFSRTVFQKDRIPVIQRGDRTKKIFPKPTSAKLSSFSQFDMDSE